MYWKHHPDAFMGYEGCVAERGLYPCASDALGVGLEDGEFYVSYLIIALIICAVYRP